MTLDNRPRKAHSQVMETTHTTWVSIGFGNDPDPMAHVLSVKAILRMLGHEIIVEAGTVSTWQGEQETGWSFLVTGPVEEIPALRVALANSAKRHRQEVIGFVGTSGGETLIKAAV